MRNLDPRSTGQRVVSALIMLLAVAWAAHEAYALLRPLIPVLIALVVLVYVFSLLFRGRR